jgi:class 3 adenylate cyclase
VALSPFLPEPDAARFLSGGLAEAQLLFGAPLPELPPPELEAGRPVYCARFQPRFRSLLLSALKAFLAELGVSFQDLSPRADVRARDRAELEAAVTVALRSIRSTDRRLGLSNLYWLALSRVVSETLGEIVERQPAAARAKAGLDPLLPTLFRRIEQGVRRDLEKNGSERVSFLRGEGENQSLTDAVLDDGLAFTEPSCAGLSVPAFLNASRRYRLSGDAFSELLGALAREVQRRLAEGERGLVNRLARHLPGFSREAKPGPEALQRYALCAPVTSYLLADGWLGGSRLSLSPKVRAELEKRPAGDLVDQFLEFVSALKRFEVISRVRESIRVPRDAELDQAVRSGLRLFDFGEAAQVLNNAVNATVLFLDLRGFTKTSEVGTISERDLTRELYTVFDAFVPHVRRYGGTVDKFLGDGMMVTYGTDHFDPLGPLNAVRTAIQCQHSLRELREKGRTQFKMGVSVHYGRVYLARFIVDEETTQNTVIGRNVNLAGRLSSAAKRPMEEDETAPELALPSRELQVTVDSAGTLFNEGIAISRACFVQLEKEVEISDVEQPDGTRRLEYQDEELERRVLLRYAGDAKFKGVKAAFPVFEVQYE